MDRCEELPRDGYPLTGKYRGARLLLGDFARLVRRKGMTEQEMCDGADELLDDFKAGKLDYEISPPRTRNACERRK